MIPIVLVSWVLDQVSKRMAVVWLKGSPPRSFLGGLFTLEYAENSGAILSLGASLPPTLRFWMFTVGTAALMLGLIVYLLSAKDVTKAVLVGLSFTIGGGTSNWFDRVLQDGYVSDFMIVGTDSFHSGVFNIADLLILGGPLILLMHSAFARKGRS